MSSNTSMDDDPLDHQLTEEERQIYWRKIEHFLNEEELPEEHEENVVGEPLDADQVLLAGKILCSVLSFGKQTSTDHVPVLLCALDQVNKINANFNENDETFFTKKRIVSQIILAYVNDKETSGAQLVYSACMKKDLLAFPEMVEFVIDNGFKDEKCYLMTYEKLLHNIRLYLRTVMSFWDGSPTQQVMNIPAKQGSPEKELMTRRKQISVSPSTTEALEQQLTHPQPTDLQPTDQQPTDQQPTVNPQGDDEVPLKFRLRQRRQLRSSNTHSKPFITSNSSSEEHSLQWSSDEGAHNQSDERSSSGIWIQRRRNWTEEEENNLRLGVERYGEGAWTKILQNYKFDRRTPVNLKDKWRNLKRNNQCDLQVTKVSDSQISDL